jgi:hypothetical protein
MTESDEKQVLAIIDGPIKAFARSQLELPAADIREPFTKALNDLSKEDAVLAFHLRGRDRLMLLWQQVDEFTASAACEASAGGTPSDEKWNFDLLLFDLAAADLEHSVRQTAWGCDLMTHMRVHHLLRQVRREETSELRKFAENLIRKLAAQSQTRAA